MCLEVLLFPKPSGMFCLSNPMGPKLRSVVQEWLKSTCYTGTIASPSPIIMMLTYRGSVLICRRMYQEHACWKPGMLGTRYEVGGSPLYTLLSPQNQPLERQVPITFGCRCLGCDQRVHLCPSQAVMMLWHPSAATTIFEHLAALLVWR